MTILDAKLAPGSPSRKAQFARGNTMVHASPRAGHPRLRPSQSGQRFKAAQQQARKPSNPIRTACSDNDGWQDIDSALEPPNNVDFLGSKPDLRPERPTSPYKPPVLHQNPALERQNMLPEPSKTTNDLPSFSFGAQESEKSNNFSDLSVSPTRSPHRSPLRWPSDEESNANSSLSFLNFSPRHASANFLRRIRRRSSRTSPRSYRRHQNSSESDSTFSSILSLGNRHSHAYSPHRGSPRRTPVRPEVDYEGYALNRQFPLPHFSPNAKPENPPLWMDPALPGQLALYLQVLFNLAMVLVVLAAIAMFYTTIRNDINLKIEEYTADIVDEIARAKYHFITNNCHSEARAPAMEDACQKWERVMQRDPKEVGRAKVGAEMLGTIIEAFVQPIGLKSIIMLTILFVGSFLLVNLVFSSRIGPRFSGGVASRH